MEETLFSDYGLEVVARDGKIIITEGWFYEEQEDTPEKREKIVKEMTEEMQKRKRQGEIYFDGFYIFLSDLSELGQKVFLELSFDEIQEEFGECRNIEEIEEIIKEKYNETGA